MSTSSPVRPAAVIINHNVADAISQLDAEEFDREDLNACLDIAVSIDTAPSPAWLQQKVVNHLLASPSASHARFVASKIINLHQKLLKHDYSLFWTGTKDDWEWLTRVLQTAQGYFKQGSHHKMSVFTVFIQMWSSIVAKDDAILLQNAFGTDAAKSNSPDATKRQNDAFAPSKSKKAKQGADKEPQPVAKSTFLVVPSLNEAAKRSFLWQIFYHATDEIGAARTFMDCCLKMMRKGRKRNHPEAAAALATLLGQFIKWTTILNKYDLLDHLLQRVVNDFTPALRMVLYDNIPDGEHKAILMDRLLREFDFTVSKNPITDALENPVSMEKLVTVLLIGRPRPIITTGAAAKPDATAGLRMKHSAFDQALCVYHLVASLLKYQSPEVYGPWLDRLITAINTLLNDLPKKPRQAAMNNEHTTSLLRRTILYITSFQA